MPNIKVIKEEVLKFGGVDYRFKIVGKKLSRYVEFPKNLHAILHKKNILELIFSPVEKSDHYLNREFSFIYLGKSYKAKFSPPSDFFKDIFVKRYLGPKDQEDAQFEDFYISLRKFKDFYSLGAPSLPVVKEYFKNKVPVNFFIEGEFDDGFNFIEFASSLNFFMRFYDRETPYLLCDTEDEKNKIKFIIPCYLDKNTFPSSIDCKKVNQILLDIFNVAISTPNIRLKYLFYFQILEYVSYYFVKEEAKKRISKILNDPNINQKINNVVKIITEESREYINNGTDSQRLEHTISSLCEYKDIRNEIEQNLDYFKQQTKFDGGFVIPPLLNDKQDVNNPSPEIMVNIKNNIEKIRNVLVHLKESREHNVILPTKNNNILLKPYLYLLRRMAELVAIQFE